MKIENTLENKAKFFAVYWGQKVVHYNSNLGGIRNISQEHFNEDSWLELTPLSQITEQDKEYLELSDGFSFDEYGCSYSMGEESWSSYEIDYLRSKCYALPWMGLSIKTLIEYGWVKLKDSL